MQERVHRLSIPTTRWSTGARSSLPSVSTPKSIESPAMSDNTLPLDTTSVATSHHRYSMSDTPVHVERVLPRAMTEPPRAIPPAVIARPRTLSQPINVPQVASGAFPSPGDTTGTTTTPGSSSQGRIRRLQEALGLSRQRKKKSGQRKHLAIGLALVVFCMTAVIYIVLAFSLPTFPNFSHIFFIGILFVEFAFVIKTLLKHAQRTRRKVAGESVEDAPPVGTVIHGASNWEGADDVSPAHFDLEEIGVVEALKPVPPAYGMYRGSVRIADTDITWVRRNEPLDHRIETAEIEGHLAWSGRPPSYIPDSGRN